jgi:hypothetical protein
MSEIQREEDEVQRLRRVRAEMHAKFKTMGAFLSYLKGFERRPAGRRVLRRTRPVSSRSPGARRPAATAPAE